MKCPTCGGNADWCKCDTPMAALGAGRPPDFDFWQNHKSCAEIHCDECDARFEAASRERDELRTKFNGAITALAKLQEADGVIIAELRAEVDRLNGLVSEREDWVPMCDSVKTYGRCNS